MEHPIAFYYDLAFPFMESFSLPVVELGFEQADMFVIRRLFTPEFMPRMN